MLRFTEIGLFLVPFGLYVAWRVMGARTPRWLVVSALVLTLAMAIGSVWFGLVTGLPSDQAYVPAELHDGQILEGHGVPPRRR
jgi:hypothetical protein